MRRMSFLTFLGCASFVLLLGACAQGMSDDQSAGDDQSGDTCGDNSCTGNETSTSCPADCGGSNAVCGDGTCNGSENATTCPADCNTAASCGDGTCNGTETINTCPADCGGGGGAVCGDGTCNGTETSTSCPVDCSGGGGAVCGDGTCNGTETNTSCPIDCTGGGGGGTCGDAVCDVAAGECDSTDINCVFDCQLFDPVCPGGGGGTFTCHDVCTTGDAQDASCGQCQSDVCAADSLCCDPSNGWDATCVQEVNTYCTGTTC
jgi:hypothetical protein